MENSVVFKDIKGNVIDPIDHTREILRRNPFVEVHVGTDSQSLAKKTQYITVIAYRYGNRGVHYILKKSGVPQIKDLWARLWKETELSIDVAETIKNSLNITPEIDLDYNENENFKSNYSSTYLSVATLLTGNYPVTPTSPKYSNRKDF